MVSQAKQTNQKKGTSEKQWAKVNILKPENRIHIVGDQTCQNCADGKPQDEQEVEGSQQGNV